VMESIMYITDEEEKENQMSGNSFLDKSTVIKILIGLVVLLGAGGYGIYKVIMWLCTQTS
jgi:hypothetical protein